MSPIGVQIGVQNGVQSGLHLCFKEYIVFNSIGLALSPSLCQSNSNKLKVGVEPYKGGHNKICALCVL